MSNQSQSSITYDKSSRKDHIMNHVTYDPSEEMKDKSLLDPELASLSSPGQSLQVPYDKEASRRLVRKLDFRMIPLACWAYLISYIDRANIGNAKVAGESKNGLFASLHLTPQKYNLSLCLFLLSYLLFGPPGNLIMKRTGPPIWIGCIVTIWGICTSCLGTVQNFSQLCAVRWLLGMAESSLFGSLVYSFTFYYRPEERSIRIAFMLASATLAGAFGGAIAAGITKLDGVRGLAAWRWIFILEGTPSILSGPLLYFLYPSFPEHAKWLSDEEKKLVVDRLTGTNSSSSKDKIGLAEIKEALKEKKMYLHYTLQFCMSLPFSSLSFFVPSIVQGLGYKGIDSNLYTVPPWAFAWVCCIIAAFIGDKLNKRGVVIAIGAMIGMIAFAVMGGLSGDDFKIRYGFLFIATAATFACFPLQSGWVAANARTTAISAIAIPTNLSIGAIGQIAGLFIYKADQAPRYPTGHFVNMSACLVSSIMAIVLILVYYRLNRQVISKGVPQPLWGY